MTKLGEVEMATGMNCGAEAPAAPVAEQLPLVPAQMRLIRLPEVIARVGIKRSTIYQRMAEGRFPKGRSIGPKSTVWVESEIDEWIRSIVEKRPV